MPELPEVETTRAGIAPYLEGKRIKALNLHRRDLRWPISDELPSAAIGQTVSRVLRRGKYLVLQLQQGAMLLHLGMSGSLRVAQPKEPLKKHDHWQLWIDEGRELRFNDPRRFGALFFVEEWESHSLIAKLGPEPLSDSFHGDYLWAMSRGRSVAIKTLIMDAKTVVGVGNIYAAESLFHAGIHPTLKAEKLSKARATKLVEEIKRVLAAAIEQGGTTLRDYVNGSGNPGYFQQELWVYGREGEPCKTCGSSIKQIRLGQRASCFCPACQKR